MKIAKQLIAFCGLLAVDRPYGVSMDCRVIDLSGNTLVLCEECVADTRSIDYPGMKGVKEALED